MKITLLISSIFIKSLSFVVYSQNIDEFYQQTNRLGSPIIGKPVFSYDGSKMLTIHEDKSFSFWDLKTAKKIENFIFPKAESDRFPTFTSSGEYIIENTGIFRNDDWTNIFRTTDLSNHNLNIDSNQNWALLRFYGTGIFYIPNSENLMIYHSNTISDYKKEFYSAYSNSASQNLGFKNKKEHFKNYIEAGCFSKSKSKSLVIKNIETGEINQILELPKQWSYTKEICLNTSGTKFLLIGSSKILQYELVSGEFRLIKESEFQDFGSIEKYLELNGKWYLWFRDRIENDSDSYDYQDQLVKIDINSLDYSSILNFNTDERLSDFLVLNDSLMLFKLRYSNKTDSLIFWNGSEQIHLNIDFSPSHISFARSQNLGIILSKIGKYATFHLQGNSLLIENQFFEGINKMGNIGEFCPDEKSYVHFDSHTKFELKNRENTQIGICRFNLIDKEKRIHSPFDNISELYFDSAEVHVLFENKELFHFNFSNPTLLELASRNTTEESPLTKFYHRIIDFEVIPEGKKSIIRSTVFNTNDYNLKDTIITKEKLYMFFCNQENYCLGLDVNGNLIKYQSNKNDVQIDSNVIYLDDKNYMKYIGIQNESVILNFKQIDNDSSFKKIIIPLNKLLDLKTIQIQENDFIESINSQFLDIVFVKKKEKSDFLQFIFWYPDLDYYLAELKVGAIQYNLSNDQINSIDFFEQYPYRQIIDADFSDDGKFLAVLDSESNLLCYDVSQGNNSLPKKSKMPVPVNYNSRVYFLESSNKLAILNSFSEIALYKINEKEIELAFYISLSKDGGILIRDNQGYYLSSKDKSKEIHFVKGVNIIGFEQLDLVYNRPDIITNQISDFFGLNQFDEITNYRESWEKRIDRLGLDKEKLGKGEIAVPDAEIVDAEKIEYENKEGNLSISVKANDPKYPLRRFNVYVNEVPLYGSAGISIAHLNKQHWDTTISVPLSIGENKIQVSVMNELGLENFKYPTYVNYRSDNQTIASKTHYIGIGVNAFQQNEYNLTYCVKDVNDLAKAFGGENTVIKIFTDSEVTRSQILQLKQYLQDSTTVNDKVIISCSSHGLLDDSLNFYLATHDVDFDNPKEKGLKYEELESLLDSIPARQKLLLLDACNSGENDKTEMLKKELEQEKATMDSTSYLATRGVIIQLEEENKNNFKKMNELFVNVRNNTGSVIISAAGGQESALEAIEVNGQKIENGAFTYSVLEYLRANEGNTDALTVNQLKLYVENKVEEITNGKQKPTSRQETMEVDWRVR